MALGWQQVGTAMNLGLVLLIILILLLVGAVPSWPHAQVWGGGYAPFSVVGLVLIVVVVLLLSGRL